MLGNSLEFFFFFFFEAITSPSSLHKMNESALAIEMNYSRDNRANGNAIFNIFINYSVLQPEFFLTQLDQCNYKGHRIKYKVTGNYSVLQRKCTESIVTGN